MSRVHNTLRQGTRQVQPKAAPEAATQAPSGGARPVIPSVLVSDRQPSARGGAAPEAAGKEDRAGHALRDIRSKEEKIRTGIASLRAALAASERERFRLAADNTRLQAELTRRQTP